MSIQELANGWTAQQLERYIMTNDRFVAWLKEQLFERNQQVSGGYGPADTWEGHGYMPRDVGQFSDIAIESLEAGGSLSSESLAVLRDQGPENRDWPGAPGQVRVGIYTPRI